MNTFSPPIEISTLQLTSSHFDVHVVREDLLPGGTKQRAIIPFLEQLIKDGYSEFVYAGPFCGFAQVALAHAGKHLNQKITLFCETISAADGSQAFHDLSLLAQSLGARIIACANLEEAEQMAHAYSELSIEAYKLPLGFNHSLFLKYYGEALETQYEVLLEKIKFSPKVIWLPVGSGTLVRLFREVLPDDITIKCVDVRVLKPQDSRIQMIHKLENIEFFTASMCFHEETNNKPPLPSNKYYDAKLWDFISEHAGHNDIWWNVAK